MAFGLLPRGALRDVITGQDRTASEGEVNRAGEEGHGEEGHGQEDDREEGHGEEGHGEEGRSS